MKRSAETYSSVSQQLNKVVILSCAHTMQPVVQPVVWCNVGVTKSASFNFDQQTVTYDFVISVLPKVLLVSYVTRFCYQAIRVQLIYCTSLVMDTCVSEICGCIVNGPDAFHCEHYCNKRAYKNINQRVGRIDAGPSQSKEIDSVTTDSVPLLPGSNCTNCRFRGY